MIYIKRRFFFIAFIAIAVLIFFSGKERRYERTIYGVFDTVSELSVFSAKDNTAEYEELLRSLHSQLDVHTPSSLIARLNSGERVTLPDDITEFLCTAVSYTNMLSDYFDITVNPIIESWELAEENGTLPEDIPEKLTLVGAESLYIDIDKNTAQITKDGASVTLGAIAKGYASDILKDKMLGDGIKSAIINLGGNVYALGTKPDGSNWSVAVADPNNTASPLLSVSLSDCAVVTSGDYERAYEIDGRKYHHIIDPKSGYPAENGLRSVTVIGRDGTLCDVLSTAIFVAGKEKASEIAQSFEVDAILIDDSFIYYTEGLEGKITLSTDKYTLSPLK
ncbi:MAG: FAD:protein FMN transferase [Clostridia bacterium]|nr:FAD:protein FMN transferase [Clostridia bacterium]